MTYRKWRFPLAVAILAVFALLFAVRGDGWVLVRKAALATQFSTSITHLGGKLVFAAVILVATLLLGRVYCSLLCPAGTVQELAARVGRRLRLARLRYVKIPFFVNLVFLAAAAVLTGAVVFDPIALFGWLALPSGEAVNNGLWGVRRLYSFETAALIALAVAVVVLVILPIFWGRIFCDVACPVGTLYRLLARLPGRRMRIVADKCVSCGKCARVCPSRCADSHGKAIEAERCLVCFDCVDACAFGAVEYAAGGAPGRRSFLGTAGAALLGGGYVASREIRQRFGVDYADTDRVTPPGTGGQVRHAARCVGCQACVLSCPVGIVRADGVDDRPVLDYYSGYCQYNCMECLASCPAGVFERMSLEEKQRTRLARVALDLERCVVKTREQDCGACAEVCPTHAVTMVPQEGGGHTVPDFDAVFCIGCGACFHVCPAEPRAFHLQGLPRHEKSAGIRLTEPAPQSPTHQPQAVSDEMTDFPF